MTSHAIAALLLLATVVDQAAAGGAAVVKSAAGAPAFVPGEVLVQFHASANAASKAAALKGQNIAKSESVSTRGDGELLLTTLPPGLAVAAAAGGLAKHPAVRFAEPNYIATKVRGAPGGGGRGRGSRSGGRCVPVRFYRN